MQNAIQSPHDRCFKGAMADIQVAREFLGYYLPVVYRNAIDLNSLTLSPNSYVNQELALSSSDVLYKATIAGEEAYVYLLCEHQSTVDALMAFRIWQYIIAIWADHLKQTTDSKKLPLVIPLVFYHGQQPYTATRDIQDLIQAPAELIQQVLFQPFSLVDTHDLSDETLRSQRKAGILAFFFKHIFDRDVRSYLEPILEHLRQLEQGRRYRLCYAFAKLFIKGGRSGTS
jgi:predicted transposase/invertase (TIGR01784 family)